jgi:hypothetical protein
MMGLPMMGFLMQVLPRPHLAVIALQSLQTTMILLKLAGLKSSMGQLATGSTLHK